MISNNFSSPGQAAAQDEVSVEREFYFQWHITERCNLRCKHCYHLTYTSEGELDDDDLFHVADRLDAVLAAWSRRGAVSLTGGEPWLRGPTVLRLIDRLAAGGQVDRVDLLTNGVLLDDHACAALAERPLLRRVQLSLEGATAQTHDAIRGDRSFHATQAAVDKLKCHGLTVAVMMTVSGANAGEVEAAIDLAEAWGIDVFSIDRFIPEGQGVALANSVLSATELQELYEHVYGCALSHRRPRVLMYRPLFCLVDPGAPHLGAMCSVGINALTILHDGTLYPCRRLPMALGNVLTDNLFDIWYTSPVLWKARTPSQFRGRCASCSLVPVCRGCRAMALAVHGDWLGEDPQCWKEHAPDCAPA